ncbi:c-type cytochrome [Pseudomonadota bacterium]
MIRCRTAVKHSIKIGFVGLLLTTIGFAVAQMKPEHTIKYRQSVMNVAGWNFYGSMAPMVKGKKAFDAKKFALNAQRVSIMLPMAAEGFTTGSDKGKTRALPEIWSNMDDFKKKMNDSIDASNKLAEIAKSGDEATMKKQFVATNKTCSGCHKKYRKKKNK